MFTKCQHLCFKQADEDHKSQERMQDMIDKLQQKIKTYKRQVEEAVSNLFFSSTPYDLTYALNKVL